MIVVLLVLLSKVEDYYSIFFKMTFDWIWSLQWNDELLIENRIRIDTQMDFVYAEEEAHWRSTKVFSNENAHFNSDTLSIIEEKKEIFSNTKERSDDLDLENLFIPYWKSIFNQIDIFWRKKKNSQMRIDFIFSFPNKEKIEVNWSESNL